MHFQHESHRIYALDAQGKLVAEITFPTQGEGVDLNHTFVDDSLRGQGVAAQLVEAAAQDLRARGLRACVTCVYAQTWFARHTEYADVLA